MVTKGSSLCLWLWCRSLQFWVVEYFFADSWQEIAVEDPLPLILLTSFQLSPCLRLLSALSAYSIILFSSSSSSSISSCSNAFLDFVEQFGFPLMHFPVILNTSWTFFRPSTMRGSYEAFFFCLHFLQQPLGLRLSDVVFFVLFDIFVWFCYHMLIPLIYCFCIVL